MATFTTDPCYCDGPYRGWPRCDVPGVLEREHALGSPGCNGAATERDPIDDELVDELLPTPVHAYAGDLVDEALDVALRQIRAVRIAEILEPLAELARQHGGVARRSDDAPAGAGDDVETYRG